MILCTDPILKERLKKKQIDATVFDSILTKNEKQKMLESLNGFATGWFIDKDGRDFTEYRDVSIGAVLSDEIMNLFQMLFHFNWLINKSENKDSIQFYDSKSCKIPEPINELISFVGGKTETCSESYPYLCFNKLYKSHIGMERNNAVVNFSEHNKGKFSIGSIFPLKIWLKVAGSRFFNFFSGKNQFVYIHVLRSLVPFFRSYMINGKNEGGLILTSRSKKRAFLDFTGQSLIKRIKEFIIYNLKGVRTDTFNYPLSRLKFTTPLNADLHKKLVDSFKMNFHQSAVNLLEYPDSKASSYFIAHFESYYLRILPSFIRAIDYYYNKYGEKKVAGCLVEFIHPLTFHIFSNLKKTSVCLPPNFFLHNQYLSPYLIARFGKYFRTVAVSEYDRSRYTKLGYTEEQIEILDPGFFNDLRSKLKPFKTIKNIQGANVLILPPWIDHLDTYRHLISNQDLTCYFSDLLDILDDLSISSINIRMHPGLDSVEMNATHYTAADCYRYFADMAIQRRGNPYSFNLAFSKSMHSNFESDVQNSDFVVGPISGSFIDTLLFGRDYVVYDNSVSPFPGIFESNLIDDGIVRCNKGKEELKESLSNYKPNNRDHIFRTYYPDIFLNNNKEKNLDCNFNQLFNLKEN